MSGKKLNLIGAIIGLLVIGYIDYATGIEVRVFPLYFIPLYFLARDFGKAGGIGGAILATFLWLISMVLGGREYSSSLIWVFNSLMQSSVFLVVTYLIASLHDMLRKERELSHTDALTGLSNGRSFFESARRMIEIGSRQHGAITLAYLDLDNFKAVNDTGGHPEGDRILRLVAREIRANTRKSDLCARMGGDEFAILMPFTEKDGARGALEKIRDALANSVEFQAYHVTCSIGAISIGSGSMPIPDLVQRADELMYAVKRSGKNRVLVESVDEKRI